MHYNIINKREKKSKKIKEEMMMNMIEIESMAASAYDGGWRAADKETEAMVEKLAEYEESKD